MWFGHLYARRSYRRKLRCEKTKPKQRQAAFEGNKRITQTCCSPLIVLAARGSRKITFRGPGAGCRYGEAGAYDCREEDEHACRCTRAHVGCMRGHVCVCERICAHTCVHVRVCARGRARTT